MHARKTKTGLGRQGKDRRASTPVRTGSAAVLAAFLAIAGVIGIGQPASAAPAVTHPGAISGIAITNERGDGALGQFQQVRITGDWAVPDTAREGDTFGMTLPSEFTQDSAAAFEIADPGTGAVLAECTVGPGQGPDMVCTLTEAVNDIQDVSGSFWLYARATRTTTAETVAFDLGSTVEIVDLPGTGGIVVPPVAEGIEPYKYGDSTAEQGRLRWIVGIPSGQVAAGGFTVTDVLEAGDVDHHYTGELRLAQRAVEACVLVGEWESADPSRYEVVFAPDDHSFTFTAAGLPTGFAYELTYYTRVDGIALAGDVVGNRATVQTTEVSSTHTIENAGGGEGTGTAYTRFSITKALTGAQAQSATDAVYTIRYSVEGSDAPARDLRLRVGEPVVSERAPLGSTFVIEEVDLPAIEGVVWGDWVITGEGVTETADGRYEVTPASIATVALTVSNTANPVAVPPKPSEPPVPPKQIIPPKPAVSAPPTTLAESGGVMSLTLLPLGFGLVAAGAVLTAVGLSRAALRWSAGSGKR